MTFLQANLDKKCKSGNSVKIFNFSVYRLDNFVS